MKITKGSEQDDFYEPNFPIILNYNLYLNYHVQIPTIQVPVLDPSIFDNKSQIGIPKYYLR